MSEDKMNEHREPWWESKQFEGDILNKDGTWLGRLSSKAIKRAILCVNACASLSAEEVADLDDKLAYLENWKQETTKRFKKYREETEQVMELTTQDMEALQVDLADAVVLLEMSAEILWHHDKTVQANEITAFLAKHKQNMV